MKAMFRLAIALSVVLMLTGVSFAGSDAIVIPVDIKPQSCPNPFNFEGRGVLPVAILGTADFDVWQIDPPSILLAGVGPLRWSYEDVSSANADSNRVPACPCNEEGPDGYLDLTLKFDTQEVAERIGNEVVKGDIIPMNLIGFLKEEFNGSRIEGADCVVVARPHDDGVTANKVTLCHRGMKTIRIGAGGVPAHLSHGDTLGPCGPF